MPRNLSRAFSLFQQAAEQRDHWGLNNLGGRYEMGWGTQQDEARARQLYEQAADLGNPHARKNIARLEAAAEQAAISEQAGDEEQGMDDEGQGPGDEPTDESPAVTGPTPLQEQPAQ